MRCLTATCILLLTVMELKGLCQSFETHFYGDSSDQLFGYSFRVSDTTYGVIEQTGARKPTMIPDKEQLVIQEGAELRISCQGDSPIQFSTMDLSGYAYSQQSNHTIVVDNNTHEYTFIVPRATAVDTGWYACSEEGMTIINDEQTINRSSENVNWIYVYVNSFIKIRSLDSRIYNTQLTVVIWIYIYVLFSAANRSFATDLGYTIIRLPGSSFVVPCRPTAEDLKPKLLFNYQEDDSELDNFKFDSKIGFIKDDVNVNDAGVYNCILPFSNNPEKVEELDYELDLDLDDLQPPFFDDNELRHLVWGRNQTITCHISFETPDSYREPYSVEWTVPSSVPETRLVRTHPTRDSSQLTIIDVQESDSGVYNCTVRKMGKQESVGRNVQFHDPNRPHLKVIESSENASFIHVTEKSTAIWAIDIDTYPKATVTWFSKDKTEITNTSKYSHAVHGLRHVFQISDVRIADAGVYTIHIDTSNQTRDHELLLVVQAAPVARIVEASSYYAVGESARFSCHISGSPLPNVTWSYLEYPDFPSKSISNRPNFLELVMKSSEFSTAGFISQVNITIKMEGDLICKSCNNIGCVEDRKSIFVSDANGSFGIIDPGFVVEGDNIDLTCGASVHNYTDDITWDVKNASRNESMIINKRKTNFTFQSILKIENVLKSDSGDYFCKAVNKNNQEETIAYRLSVLDAQVPSIIESNMNNSQIIIDLGKDEKATRRLTCSVEGMPFPEITWLKNGERLENNEQYAISFNKSELHIKYFFSTDGGNYSCRAKSRLGVSEKSLSILIEEAPRNNGIWIALICVLIVVIVGVVIYMRFKVKREERLKKEYRNIALSQIQQRSPEFNLNDEDELIPVYQGIVRQQL
ncbi:vascular endothelial growth factor receptor 1-like [Diprion similis]|uniref:vascular endothelial growth factor receptor 1-like n=1 Tax=Diprion similis TaxID=362088 RepID=UPI001EF93CF7|nr:vascular endothelial growth factor receptor 1-like [Diprion similis]